MQREREKLDARDEEMKKNGVIMSPPDAFFRMVRERPVFKEKWSEHPSCVPKFIKAESGRRMSNLVMYYYKGTVEVSDLF